MAILVRGKNGLLSRIKTLVKLERFSHTLVDGGLQAQFYREMGSDSVDKQGYVDISKWRQVDSRTCGITRSMISRPSWTVLKILQGKGHEAYLVGGCVRDLLLNRIPKDFDVITTATLKQIRKQFHRANVVGQRFPICRVHVNGSVIEVSSFETVAEHAEEREEILFSQMPRECDERDLIRWRNSLHRDFTINSLFFDPFLNKIYDYANGMMDLKSFKLRTLIPAQVSFKEDCARILRGLRIAARLGLSFSKETEAAIWNYSSSITSLAKSRIMMELNYMLSYGAAEPSLFLLRRFNLLGILLPFHAAYLDEQANKQRSEGSMMLMKLFFNMDKLVACDRPSGCNLWVGLLAFHLALVNNPQDALVIWTFSSVLYHGNWKEGVKFARERAQVQVNFSPEISKPCDYKSDTELAEKVTGFALLVQASIDALTELESLSLSMSRFQFSPCSDLVFVPKKIGKDAAQLFDVLVNDIESYEDGRENFWIDYQLLGKGDLYETSFVIGKVILDTMSCGIVQEAIQVVEEKNHLQACDFELKPNSIEDNCHLSLSDLIKHEAIIRDDRKRKLLQSNPDLLIEREKKQKLAERNCKISQQVKTMKTQRAVKNLRCPEVVEDLEASKNHKGQEMSDVIKERNCLISPDELTIEPQKVLEKCGFVWEEIIQREEVVQKNNCQLGRQEIMEKNNKRTQLVAEKSSRQSLSGLFK